MKRFRVQMTVVWYEDYNWEKSEHEYYDSEEEYVKEVKSAIDEDGAHRIEWREIESCNAIVEVEDA